MVVLPQKIAKNLIVLSSCRMDCSTLENLLLSRHNSIFHIYETIAMGSGAAREFAAKPEDPAELDREQQCRRRGHWRDAPLVPAAAPRRPS